MEKYLRTDGRLADVLTKGMVTTMQWHSVLTLWQLRRPYESSDVRSFSREPFFCTASAKPQAMSQVITQAEFVDQMWDQHSSKVLKPGCTLDNDLTLEQLSKHESICTQDKRDLLARMLFAMHAEGRSKTGLRDSWSRRHRIVENARSRSSRLLRFCSVYGKTGGEHARRKLQQKGGRSTSSNTRHPQKEKVENNFKSDSTYFSVPKTHEIVL